MNNLKHKAINGVFWSGIERFSVQGIQFVLSIIIARLLLPSDYGLVAMLTIFLAIAQSFVDSGFSNALIQRQNRTETDFSTVFYCNIGIGVFFYFLLYIFSSNIAHFYSEPQLEKIAKVAGLNIVIMSLGVVQRAKLSIDLNFKLQAFASLFAVIGSGIVGVCLAYYHYGAWALVVQSLLNNFFNISLLWILSKWKPKLIFSLESFKTLFSFGSKLLLSGLLHSVYTNLYSLAIGKKMNPADLGYFNRASSFALFPSNNITEILRKVLFPVLCSIQDDEKKLEKNFLEYLRLACFLIFPFAIGLAVLSKPLVEVILTKKWLGVVPILQILSIAYMWDPVMRINNHLLYIKGRTDYTLKGEIIKKIVAFGILLGTISFGLKIISLGVLLYSFVDIFIITRFTRRVSKVTLFKEIKNLYPVLFLALLMGAVIWLVAFLIQSSLLKLIVGVAVGILFYCIGSKIFKFREIVTIQDIIFRLIKKQK